MDAVQVLLMIAVVMLIIFTTTLLILVIVCCRGKAGGGGYGDTDVKPPNGGFAELKERVEALEKKIPNL